MKLSLVIPCYNEQDVLLKFYKEITSVLSGIDCVYELLFVDDGSEDDTLAIIRELSGMNSNVFYISFSRNFGKEAAMYAGLQNATGDYVAVMDADLQDPPSLLSEMYDILQTGKYDCVAARRTDRTGEPKLRSWFAKRFYSIINKISEVEIVDGARDFRMMRREMAEAIVSVGEYNRFSKGICGWVGFRTFWLSYENKERAAGKTKWNFWKLFGYGMSGITDFSQVPLQIASWFGIFITILSFFMLIFVVVRKLIFGDPVAGWASTVCIIMFIGGVQTFCIGILGQYMAKMYMEVKRRPHYIVAETNKKKKMVDEESRIGHEKSDP